MNHDSLKRSKTDGPDGPDCNKDVKVTYLNEGILLEGIPRIVTNRRQVMIKIDLEGVYIHDGFEWKFYGLSSKRSYILKNDPVFQNECKQTLEKFKEDWFK